MTGPVEPIPDRSHRGKRLIDLAVLAVLAVPATAVWMVCAVAVAVSSRGPILFTQTRIGHRGEAFTILKFRSMIDNPDGNALLPDTDEITTVGRALRRSSLDELPQLWNVFRGEMSLVGPRPTLPYQVERYDDRQRGRLAVRPGLTCLAQVGGRNTLTWAERIDLDLEYVDRASIGLDVRILLRTVPAVLTGAGVGGHADTDPLSATRGDEAAGARRTGSD